METQTQAIQSSAVHQTAIEKLFSKAWLDGNHHSEAIVLNLHLLADSMERDLSRGRTVDVYLANLLELTPAQCVRAFSRASSRGRFFPAPGELRALAGVVDVDPDEEQATAALVRVLAIIRDFGVRLRPIRGRVLRDRDDDGRILPMSGWVRAEDTLPPVLDFRVLRAIRHVGVGNVAVGLEILARHPTARGAAEGIEPKAETTWDARDRDKLEERWAQAWRWAGTQVSVRGNQ